MDQHKIFFSGNKNHSNPIPAEIQPDFSGLFERIGNGEGDAYEYLPTELVALLPKLYAQEKAVDENGNPNPMVYLKLFSPTSKWTWYITEGEQMETDFLCFGLVDGFEREFGYISMNEIKEIRGHTGLRIERDLSFRPQRLNQIRELKEQVH